MDLTLNDVCKSFDGKHNVIDHLSLKVASGELMTLLGSSGCGKTTLLRMVAGLENPDQGEIVFGDKLVFSKEKKTNLTPFQRGVAMVFQDFALWPNMSVRKNVEFGLKSQGRSLSLPLKEGQSKREAIHEEATNALQMVKMDGYADRLPSELSGGQKQRVAIARAIAIHPQVILFDEPLSALDAILREQMRGEIRDLVKSLGITAIFVTHDQAEAMAISDEIVVMNQGRIEERGTPEEIYGHPKRKYVADFIGKASWLDEKHFLRPEAIRLGEGEGDQSIEACLISVQYLGGQYECFARDETGTRLCFKSQKKLEVGGTTSLFYSPNDVQTVD